MHRKARWQNDQNKKQLLEIQRDGLTDSTTATRIANVEPN